MSHRITAAINAAEMVAKPLVPASTPVTVSQETLCALIEAAKRLQELNDE